MIFWSFAAPLVCSTFLKEVKYITKRPCSKCLQFFFREINFTKNFVKMISRKNDPGLKVPVPTLKWCCLSETTLFRHFTVVCFRGEFQEVFCFVLKPNSVFEIYVVLLLLHSVCIIYEVFFPQIIYGFLAIYKDKAIIQKVFFL